MVRVVPKGTKGTMALKWAKRERPWLQGLFFYISEIILISVWHPISSRERTVISFK